MLSEKLYRLLLVAYPREHRREYGELMVQLFRDRMRRDGGGLGSLNVWLEMIVDLVGSALKEHRYGGSMTTRMWTGNSSPGPIIVCAILLFFGFHLLREFIAWPLFLNFGLAWGQVPAVPLGPLCISDRFAPVCSQAGSSHALPTVAVRHYCERDRTCISPLSFDILPIRAHGRVGGNHYRGYSLGRGYLVRQESVVNLVSTLTTVHWAHSSYARSRQLPPATPKCRPGRRMATAYLHHVSGRWSAVERTRSVDIGKRPSLHLIQQDHIASRDGDDTAFNNSLCACL